MPFRSIDFNWLEGEGEVGKNDKKAKGKERKEVWASR